MTNKKLYPTRPVLIVDDEKSALKTMQKILENAGITNIITISDGTEVEPTIAKKKISVMLLDLMMPEISGAEVLMATLAQKPDLPVIMTTADSDIKSVVTCMREGAFDYITKPLVKDSLISSVKQAIDISELSTEVNRIDDTTNKTVKNPHVFSRILTKSEKMKDIFRYCEAIAGTQFPILIQGEIGTGKLMLAKALHELSDSEGEFIIIDGGKNDGEGFLDTKSKNTAGKSAAETILEKAKGGTLYLKNVSDLSIRAQIKLLTLLDEKIYNEENNNDVNLILSSQKDLDLMSKTNKFRMDLYYRLASHSFTVPPLKDRPEDLPILLSAFIDTAAFQTKKKVPAYHRDLVTLLKSYHFPDNVSQLKKMCLEAVKRHKSRMLSNMAFKDNMGRYEEYGGEIDPMTEGAIEIICSMKELPKMKELCDGMLEESMNRSNSNQRVAALMLGISPQTMGNRIKKLRAEQKKKRRKKRK
ncbi:MAG: sigma-54-dependent Fis family transcriptional regulator [Planctomycetes bacterium]|nr:sigma-54-dependent Fis family transcriptional regulator [Planctomycetota bacterium]